MPAASTNSPRKEVVRTEWNTPILRAIHDLYGVEYFYCGLPGHEALDILLWRDMIRRVVAFEIEDGRANNRRHKIAELTAVLEKARIPSIVYTGYLEDVVLDSVDANGEALKLDETVTLYNLDFCNNISSKIIQPKGHKCMRFAALRALMSIQDNVFVHGGDSRFVILLTVRQEIHDYVLKAFQVRQDLPNATAGYLAALPDPEQPYAEKPHILRSSSHLKAFVFTMLREYCGGHSISTHFLPMVKYNGRNDSPMLHFTVLCRCTKPDHAFANNTQSPDLFLHQISARATDDDIIPEPCGKWESEELGDNIVAVRQFFGYEDVNACI